MGLGVDTLKALVARQGFTDGPLCLLVPGVSERGGESHHDVTAQLEVLRVCSANRLRCRASLLLSS